MSTATVVLTPDLLTQLARDIAVVAPCPLCENDPVLTIRSRLVFLKVWHADKCADRPVALPVEEVLAVPVPGKDQ